MTGIFTKASRQFQSGSASTLERSENDSRPGIRITSAEFFNLLNEAHFSFPDGTINQPTAGVISSTADSARQIQFGLKLIF